MRRAYEKSVLSDISVLWAKINGRYIRNKSLFDETRSLILEWEHLPARGQKLTTEEKRLEARIEGRLLEIEDLLRIEDTKVPSLELENSSLRQRLEQLEKDNIGLEDWKYESKKLVKYLKSRSDRRAILADFNRETYGDGN